MAQQSNIGVIGMAVMGQNLALNIAEKGFHVSVYNRTTSKMEEAVKRAQAEGLGDNFHGHAELADFVKSLSKPRAAVILVQAGRPVDAVIEQLSQLFEAGDIIIDGGNEWYTNTERRAEALAQSGIRYMGMGVSGGESGARHGPSLMPGGPREGWEQVRHIMERIAAQTPDDGPCVTYLGPGGAGNYVKMVHNGIEYGDMQLIAEAYDLLKNVGGLSNDDLAKVFAEWNTTELESYLIEITAKIFTKRDEDGQTHLVDRILDKTGSKGTGKWTVQQAAELGVPAPTMAAALDMRYMSSLKEERKSASQILRGPANADTSSIDKTRLVNATRSALYAAKICSYAQGMNLIRKASDEHNWNVNLSEAARIWKGGCIIRARMLDTIKSAFKRNANVPNLLLDEEFAKLVNERSEDWRWLVSTAMSVGVTVPGFCASLAYFDSYRRENLPANLTQAQRDYFGAHTYQRNDRDGVFHTEWPQ